MLISSPWQVLLSLSVDHSDYSSPLALSFLKTAKFHLPCFVSGSVNEVESEQEPHRT